ncbi:hypothetical protein AUJ14_02740 [Candidatus Micrarchaeota archaeon CG1_02_55_22]|nr:MAG: hypothetical protein AUJ14_02740 [Candidatus Micrarchaeota archaeon CG1_02_55_22]
MPTKKKAESITQGAIKLTRVLAASHIETEAAYHATLDLLHYYGVKLSKAGAKVRVTISKKLDNASELEELVINQAGRLRGAYAESSETLYYLQQVAKKKLKAARFQNKSYTVTPAEAAAILKVAAGPISKIRSRADDLASVAQKFFSLKPKLTPPKKKASKTKTKK